MAPQAKSELSTAVHDAQKTVDRKRYDEVVANPEEARNDPEKLIALSAREIFILVDRSGSMGDPAFISTKRLAASLRSL